MRLEPTDLDGRQGTRPVPRQPPPAAGALRPVELSGRRQECDLRRRQARRRGCCLTGSSRSIASTCRTEDREAGLALAGHPARGRAGNYEGTVAVQSRTASTCAPSEGHGAGSGVSRRHRRGGSGSICGRTPGSSRGTTALQPWSDAHRALLKQHLKLYADAGGKYITTYAVHSPWQDNSYMIEGGMIDWIKRNDGSWAFDYRIFDEYVSLAMEAGINKAITIYTPLPWANRFRYLDERTGNLVVGVVATRVRRVQGRLACVSRRSEAASRPQRLAGQDLPGHQREPARPDARCDQGDQGRIRRTGGSPTPATGIANWTACGRLLLRVRQGAD